MEQMREERHKKKEKKAKQSKTKQSDSKKQYRGQEKRRETVTIGKEMTEND